MFFIRAALSQRYKRILNMTRRTSSAAYALNTVTESASLNISFFGITAVKRNQIIIHFGEIKTKAESPADPHFPRGSVGNADPPCYNIIFRKNRIIQRNCGARHGVFCIQFKRLRFAVAVGIT